MVIDLTPDDSDGERPSTAASSSSPSTLDAEPYSQTIEVLAPLFPELSLRRGEREIAVFPVTFQRTEADWIKLVFPHVSASPTHAASSSNSARQSLQPLEKELVCANSTADGCRNCHFAQLLRGLLVLIEKGVLLIDAKYVVSFSNAKSAIGATNTNNSAGTLTSQPESVATIQLFVQLNEDAPTSVNLQEFEFVTSHLQPAILSVVGYTRVQADETLEDLIRKAKESTCHVVGCNLHQRDGILPGVSSKTLYLSDVFRTLTSPTDIDQMEIREDRTYVERMKRQKREVIVTDLPIIALQTLVCMMNARDLASLSGVCSLFQHLAYEVVPGLNLVLYRHQRKALKFLLYREAPPSAHKSALPHPFIFPPVHRPNASISIDLVDRKIVNEPTPSAQDCRGGLFCDEPGLGKTITMLALLLRTKGQRVKSVPETEENSSRKGTLGRLRSSGSRGRTVQASQLVNSASTLIVVPNPLVDHWKFQIETHVEPGALKVFIDSDHNKPLPSSAELVKYDVVITSFLRLLQEWKTNRPTSALEERAPERYGFEDHVRFADGTIRGEMSSLLRVHWVRIVVDEGHQLGGTAETSQMRMARIFCAERRWVMTGTPTPNTMQSADLRHMHGLLVFLKDVPYGHQDGKAWLKAIAKPFEKNDAIAFLRLQHLLSRIMMRHTKELVREIIPDPIWRTVFIDPTPKEHDVYNAVAGIVRANLVVTNHDPKYPGRLHLDSLLNPHNSRYAMQVVRNLRIATCGGHSMNILLPPAAQVDAINYANESGIQNEKLTSLIEYMHRAQEVGVCSTCESCRRQFKLLMLVPCGHLCCADCVGDRIESVGPNCSICNAVYDIEIFQKLQPGFEFAFQGGTAMVDLNVRGAASRSREREREAERRQVLHAWQERMRSGEERVPNPRRAINYLRDFDIIDASKALYVVARVKELKKEYARNYAEASVSSRSQNVSRHVKAIVFSQFKDHIWEVKVAFAQQGIQTADFIAGWSAKTRMENLAKFRKDPSVTVLLLTEVGSHGLDLSFVTHVFLMEEIWDKSLEKQVVSRAHRMGARQAVVVEQLVMRDTIEVLLLRMNEQILKRQERRLKAAEAEELSLINRNEQQGQHRLSKGASNLEAIFQAHKKHKKRHKAKMIVPSVPVTNDSNENKATRLQQQLYYVLQNLRLLGEEAVAELGHVRFSVEDEHGNVLREGSHRMAAYKTSTGQLVMMPPVSASDAGNSATAGSASASSSRPVVPGSGASRTSTSTAKVKKESRVGVSAGLPAPTAATTESAPVVARASVPQLPATPAPVPQDAAAPAPQAAAPTAAAAASKKKKRKRGVIGFRSATETPLTVKSEAAATNSNDPSAIPSPIIEAASTSLKTEPPSEQNTTPPTSLKPELSQDSTATTPKTSVEVEANQRRAHTTPPRSEKPKSKRSESSAVIVKAETTASPTRPTAAVATMLSPASLGSAADPIMLSDEDEDEDMSDAPVIVSDDEASRISGTPTLRTSKYEATAAAQAPRNSQKRPIRRVKFANHEDKDNDTESDYIPSDIASD